MKIKIHNPYYGVPVTFLGDYNPEQFEIIGITGRLDWANSSDCPCFTPPKLEIQKNYKNLDKTWRIQNPYIVDNGVPKTIYTRILIKRKR